MPDLDLYYLFKFIITEILLSKKPINYKTSRNSEIRFLNKSV